MSSETLRIGPADAADWPGVGEFFVDALHHLPDRDALDADGQLFEPARSLVARRGGRVVAHVGSTRRELTVPGGVVPAAHVDRVAVAPDERRRGVLTDLMHRQLAGWRRDGEPLAVLWATDPAVYPRFGFGPAVPRLVVDLDRRDVRLAGPVPGGAGPGRVDCCDPSTAAADLRAVYERVCPERPGWSARDDLWWRHRVLADPPGRRHGATAWRAVVHRTPDGPEGYGLWRARPERSDGETLATVEVRELVAASPRALRALWGFLLSLDLTRRVQYPLAATDDPLMHLVDGPRRLGARLTDGLWLRIVDLPAALTGRRYAAPLDVVLEVTDGVLPGNRGRWRLTAGPEGARCERTGEPADLGCDVRVLGAAYLGEGVLPSLADAGDVEELRPGAVRMMHRAWTWDRGPSVVERF